MFDLKKWWALAIILIINFDQVSKTMARELLTLGESHPVLPGFDLQLAYNTGAAFSLMSNGLPWQRYSLLAFSIAASIGFVIYLSRLKPEQQLEGWALSFILGGTLGNLWDRLFFGYVIDFISIHYRSYYWPTFNIADSCICVGAGLLMIEMWRTAQGQSKHGVKLGKPSKT